MIYIALSLGFAGSLHCIGMCGPLMGALHIGQGIHAKKSLIYHTGRILGYGLMGWLMGWIGFGMQWVVPQQGVALIAGMLVLLATLWPSSWKLTPKALQKYTANLRQQFMRRWSSGSTPVVIALGFLNAWLPCGLVYTALAASIVTTSPMLGAVFMMLFGIANTPALFFSTQIITHIEKFVGHRHKKGLQRMLVLFSLLLILRGASLGIPYLSPDLSGPAPTCCHR